MKPKEKAKELVERFEEQIGCSALNVVTDAHDLDEETKELAKQCALICVDEIIKEYTTLPHFAELYDENIDYWQEVKKEIVNL